MPRNARRTLLKSGLALSAGAVAAGAAPARAQGPAPAKTVLAVPPTYIAIAGTTDVFPVRRIYTGKRTDRCCKQTDRAGSSGRPAQIWVRCPSEDGLPPSLTPAAQYRLFNRRVRP